MKDHRTGGSRNFGYGRSMSHAIRNILKQHYGEGRFGTRATVASRLYQFERYLKKIGVRDLGNVTRCHCESYASFLADSVVRGELSNATAVNCASAVNVLFFGIRGDKEFTISPKQYVATRRYVRRTVPLGMNAEDVELAARALELAGEERVAGMLLLCRTFGLRFREAALLDIRRSIMNVRRNGQISIIRGTKGGRPRTFEVPPAASLMCLRRVLAWVGEDRCLVPVEMRFDQFNRRCHRVWRRYSGEFGLSPRFRELRSSYACTLYETCAGMPAPVITSGRTAPREADEKARLKVATVLGHGRPAISSSYVGTARVAKETKDES